MDTEIEIKFFVSAKAGKRLPAVMAKYKVVDTSSKQLHNVYFDTASNTLRDLDCGLRVRTCDGQSVQTLKTKGKAIGGLHQRPEYNIGIDTARPLLSLFPEHVWSKSIDLELLQTDLTPLFTTHFERQAWLLSLDDETLVEVALDIGEVNAKFGREAICEIELEIVKGDVAQLFELAKQIAALGNVRLANVSKAQRGYRLAQGYQTPKPSEITFVPLDPEDSLDNGFHQTIQSGLAHWQTHEQLFCESPSLANVKQILQGMQLIHQGLLHYSQIAPQLSHNPWLSELVYIEQQLSWVPQGVSITRLLKNKGHYLRKLANQKQLIKGLKEQQNELPSFKKIEHLLHSERYAQLMVSISRWLYSRSWQNNKLVREQLSAPITEFSSTLLNDSWKELKASLVDVTDYNSQQMLGLKGRLQRNLLAGICFGACFDNGLQDEFRHPWLDIAKGIDDLQLLEQVEVEIDALVKLGTEAISDEDKHLAQRWLKRKINALVEAMRFSLSQAVQMQPYWY